MSSGEIVLKYMVIGLEYLKVILPVLLAWHLPAPSYMKPQAPVAKEEGQG